MIKITVFCCPAGVVNVSLAGLLAGVGDIGVTTTLVPDVVLDRKSVV